LQYKITMGEVVATAPTFVVILPGLKTPRSLALN
jgi:hypothetical protein